MKKIFVAILAVMAFAGTCFATTPSGYYMNGATTINFKGDSFEWFVNEKKLLTTQYKVTEDEMGDFENERYIEYKDSSGKDRALDVFFEENGDFRVHRIDDKNFLPSLLFKKMDSFKQYNENFSMEKLEGMDKMYVHPLFGEEFGAIQFYRGEISERMGEITFYRGWFEEIARKADDPKEGIRIRITDANDGSVREKVIMERMDGSLKVIDDKEGIREYIVYEPEVIEEEKKFYVDLKSMHDPFTDEDIAKAKPFELYGIYADSLTLTIYHFQGDTVTYYLGAMPIFKYKIYNAEGNKKYMVPLIAVTEKDIWTIEVKDNGNIVYVNDGKNHATLTKRAPGTIQTIVGTLY